MVGMLKRKKEKNEQWVVDVETRNNQWLITI